MNWLTDLPRKLQSFIKKEAPDNLWTKCPKCEQMLFHREISENHWVCRHCQYHMRMPAKRRIELFLDPTSIQFIPSAESNTVQDPLQFRDQKRYSERLKDARQKTENEDALVAAKGLLHDIPVVVAAFDFNFMGGSMGVAVGELFLAAVSIACQENTPFIVVPSSGGARMQEGLFALMQMPRTVIGVSWLREAKLPYITVLADPTTGGVQASFASLGDIAIAEPGAIIGFTGARVIQETLRVQLPKGFQTAEFQYEHGFVDMIVHRHHLKARIASILSTLLANRQSFIKG